jgi:hypothetical protein
MKYAKYLSINILLLFSSILFSQENEIEIKEITNPIEIIESKSEMIEAALFQKNTIWLGQLLHDKLILGHSNGWTETKESLIESLPTSKVVYREFKNIRFPKVNMINENLITLQKNLTAVGEYENEPFEANLKILEVWIYEDSDWQLLARQSVDDSE